MNTVVILQLLTMAMESFFAAENYWI